MNHLNIWLWHRLMNINYYQHHTREKIHSEMIEKRGKRGFNPTTCIFLINFQASTDKWFRIFNQLRGDPVLEIKNDALPSGKWTECYLWPKCYFWQILKLNAHHRGEVDLLFMRGFPDVCHAELERLIQKTTISKTHSRIIITSWRGPFCSLHCVVYLFSGSA